jgi:pheromone shutdown protein TraB
MITLLGVGHVFDISDKVEAVIFDRRPSIVCVELDEQRLYALTHRDAPRVGEPLMHRLLAIFQKRIAKMYGVEVGNEMLAAIEAARKIRARVALIDMESELAYQRFMQEMTFEEKIKFVVGLITGLFTRKKDVDKMIKLYEETSADYMALLGKEYPSIKKVLIDERNQYMSAIVREISKTHKRMVVVVGDGHINGMRRLLKDRVDHELDIIRLRDLRQNKWKRLHVSSDVTASVTYSFEV